MALTEAEKEARATQRRLSAALCAKEDPLRHESQRREWVEQGMFLTREQAAAGAPYRGCGIPVIDNLGSWRESAFGSVTGRDSWSWGFSRRAVATNMKSMIENYNRRLDDFQLDGDIEKAFRPRGTEISWTRSLKANFTSR